MGVWAIGAGVIAAVAYFFFNLSSPSYAEIVGQSLLMFVAGTGAVGGIELIWFLMSAEAQQSQALTNRHLSLNIGAGAVLVLSLGGLAWPFVPRADAFALRDASGLVIVEAYHGTTEMNSRRCREVEAALEAGKSSDSYYCMGRQR
jgi:hypothetical protein